MNNFGDYLKELRGDLSLREMEKITGLSHTYLSSLEKGFDPRSKKERKPTPETLRKLSSSLNVPYDHLMYRAGYIDELPNYDWLLNEDHTQSTSSINVHLPTRISLKDENGVILTKGARSEEELKSWLFDLRYLLNLQVDLFYNKRKLSIDQREEIELFVREVVKREE